MNSGISKILSDLLCSGDLDEKMTVSHYLPMGLFKEVVTNNQIGFSAISNWEDRLEMRFVECNYGRGYKVDDVACLCLSMKSKENQAASWLFRNRKNESYVMIKFRLIPLLNQLEAWCEKNNCKLFLERVHYIEDDDFTTIPPKVVSSIENFTDEDYVRLLSFKRKAFQFENEIRIFILGKALSFFKTKKAKKILRVDLDNDFRNAIVEVKLNPLSADKVWKGSDREKYKDEEMDELKVFVQKYFPNVTDLSKFVVRSRLYENAWKCKWNDFEKKHKAYKEGK